MQNLKLVFFSSFFSSLKGNSGCLVLSSRVQLSFLPNAFDKEAGSLPVKVGSCCHDLFSFDKQRELFCPETSFPPLRKEVFMYSCGELLTRGLNSGKRKHPFFFLDPPGPPRFPDPANGKTEYGSLKTPLGKWRPGLYQDSYKIWRADKVASATVGACQMDAFREALLPRQLAD